jgi:hypothetical protein
VIPRRAQLFGFLVLMAGTIAMMVFLRRHGSPLDVDDVHRIIALELAPTRLGATHIVEIWQKHRLIELALEDIRFDYAFIALYSTTLAFACFFGGTVLSGWLARAGPKLAWSMWLAGLMDVIENLGMTAELGGCSYLAPLVCTASSIKWILSGIGLVYALMTIVTMVIRWPRLIRDPAS